MEQQQTGLRVILAGLEDLGGLRDVDGLPIEVVQRLSPSEGQEALIDATIVESPHFVFVSGDTPNLDGLSLAELVWQQQLPVSVVLLTDRQEKEFLLQAALSGVEEILPKSATPEQVKQLIRRVITSRRGKRWQLVLPSHGERQALGRVIALSSGKGGVGRTSLIVNLAVALAQETNEPVALLDLFIGDTLAMVNAVAKRTLSEIPEGIREIDLEMLRQYAVQHETGVHFYTWFFSPERNLPEYIDWGRLEIVLKTLRSGYRFILVDAPLTIFVPDLELMTLMDEVFIVTVLWDLPSLRATKALAMGMQKWKVVPKLLFNRVRPDAELTPDFVANQLGLELWDTIPNDTRAVVRSINLGTPTVLADPKSEYAQAVRRIARRLAGIEIPLEEEQRRRRFFF